MSGDSAFAPVELPAGTRLYTVVRTSWPEPHSGFPNPDERRFSPVMELTGQVASVLYAGDGPTCALGETVFRDLRGGAPVPRQRLHGSAMLTIQTEDRLLLADLRSIAARAVGAHEDAWGGPPGAWAAAHYGQSRQWAQRVFEDTAAPTATKRWGGVAWNSHQDLQQSACLLFMGRDVVLTPEGAPEPLTQQPWRAVIGEYATRLRTVLPISW